MNPVEAAPMDAPVRTTSLALVPTLPTPDPKTRVPDPNGYDWKWQRAARITAASAVVLVALFAVVGGLYGFAHMIQGVSL